MTDEGLVALAHEAIGVMLEACFEEAMPPPYSLIIFAANGALGLHRVERVGPKTWNPKGLAFRSDKNERDAFPLNVLIVDADGKGRHYWIQSPKAAPTRH